MTDPDDWDRNEYQRIAVEFFPPRRFVKTGILMYICARKKEHFPD